MEMEENNDAGHPQLQDPLLPIPGFPLHKNCTFEAKHKIQSTAGPLDMRLTQVPKMLRILRIEWAPSAFCVSFKLETDPDILLQKAESALSKYQMHVVVANELATYKREVILVTVSGKVSIRKQSEDADVEDELIKLLVEKHSEYIKSCRMG